MHWAGLPKGSWLCQSRIDNAGGFRPLLYSLHSKMLPPPGIAQLLLTLFNQGTFLSTLQIG